MQRLSGLQLAVIRVLWRLGRATVADVQCELESERPLAYSTLATILKRLEDKGVVRHEVEGRTYVYEPLIAADQVGYSVVSDLVEKVFAGRPSELVSHLLESHEVKADELVRIKAMIDEHLASSPTAERAPKRRKLS
jgi:BlaI family penicillinase repressor